MKNNKSEAQREEMSKIRSAKATAVIGIVARMGAAATDGAVVDDGVVVVVAADVDAAGVLQFVAIVLLVVVAATRNCLLALLHVSIVVVVGVEKWHNELGCWHTNHH